MKNRCRMFPNCRRIADKMNIPVNWLYTYIRGYNEYARQNKLETISASKAYSQDELDDIQSKLEAYQKQKLNDESERRKDFSRMAKSFGSSNAYASYVLHQSGLTGQQISSIANEIYRTFIYVCDQLAIKTQQDSFDLIVKKFGVVKLLGQVKQMMLASTNSIASNKSLYDDNPSLRASISDEDYNRYVEALDIANKLFVRTGYENQESLPDFFYEACILALPMINTALSSKINEDFVFIKTDAKGQEEAENVYDLEEPTVEHWQDVIDKMCPETSISNIIKRILMNTEKKVIKSTVKYYQNGKEVNHNEQGDKKSKIVSSLVQERVTPKTPIMGLPYTNNPALLARNLFKILESCSSESSMMNVLSRHEEFSELYDLLNRDSRLRTTFFANFNKYNMQMSKTSAVRMSDGTYTINDVKLNSHSKKDRLLGYISKLRLNKVSDNAIYYQEVNKSEGELGVELGKTNRFSASWLKFSEAKKRFEETIKDKIPQGDDRNLIVNNICYLLDCLNLDADLSIAYSICDNIAVYRDFINNISLFFEVAEREFFNNAKQSKNISQVLQSNREIRNILDNILKIVNPLDANDMVGSNMAEFAGNRISTRIQPSAITNLIKKFKDCTYEEFMSWINSEYLDSEQFIEDPMDPNSRIWNRWLADMVREANTSLGAGGFKDIFNIARNLGFNDVKFERISDRDHMLSVLFGYLQNRVRLEDNTELAELKGDSLFIYNPNTNKYDIEVPEQKRKGRKFLILGDTVIRRYDNTVGQNGRVAFTESKRKDVATIPMFITGDTNSLRQFRTIHYYEEEILDGLYGLYRSDMNTQKVVNEFNKRGFMVSSNGKETFTKFIDKFGVLTFLNKPEWKQRLDAITAGGLAEEDAFKQLVKEYLDEEFEKFYNTTLQNLGLLQTDQNGKYIYFNNFLSSDNKEDELKSILKDFFYNYKFGLYNQTNLQHITTLFFNGVEDHQKRNKGQGTTGTSLSSEAEINGEKLWDSTNFAEKVVYFKDVKNSISDEEAQIISDFIIRTFTPTIGAKEAQKKAKQLVKVYQSNSLTDGQGIRSIESYRRVLASAGENFWTREQEAAYQKIQSIITPAREQKRNLTADEIQTIENMTVVMQPIKPINDGIETFQIGSTVAKIGFQLKYAEVPLIPEMYPVGSRLRQIGDWMRSANVDMICSDKCLKKGSFGEVDIQYKAKDGVYVDSDDNVLPGIDAAGNEVTQETHGRKPTMAEQRRYITNGGKDNRVEYGAEISFADIIANQSIVDADGNELNYVIHNIPMDNYLIQNNIPDHSNGKVVVGTQQRKLIGSMIYDGVEYTIGGKKISGSRLRKIYNALHTAKYFKSYKKFLSIINDPQALSKNLSFSIAQSSRGSLNLLDKVSIDEDGNPMIPYSELGNSREITNNLISIFKKFVIRQQISGGNIVQATAMGIGEVLSDPTLGSIYDENGVEIGIEIEMPFFFEVNIDGIPVKLKYEKYCNDDGTFKPGINGSETLIEEDYPGILDMEIHRIPTEGGYSMCRAHIKRCSPKTAANTMKRPAKLTSRFDDDFDIDKMFFSRKVYNYASRKKQTGDKTVFDADVWNRIYDENPTIKAKLLWAAGRSDKAVKGIKRATRKQEEELAQEYNTTVDKLHLNYYWDIAHITIDKTELFTKYAEEELAKRSGKDIIGEYEVDKDFDFESDDSAILDLSVSTIDNAIFEINQAVLSDASTMVERITPGGFADMSENARVIRCLRNKELIPEWKDKQLSTEEDFNEFVSYIKEHSELDFKQEYDYSDPETLILFKQWNQVAGEEIGIFANNNVNDAISRALSKFKIKKPTDSILFGSLVKQIADIDTVYGLNKDIGLDFLFNTVNGRSVAKTLHELLGSSVDAVKDNALIDINLNSVTGDAGAMLVRLGYSTLDVGLLFNQPIVKDTLLYMSRSGEKNISNALKAVLESNKYNIKVKYNTLSKPYSKDNVSSSKLARNIYSGTIDVASQLDVAKLINKIMSIQMEVARYVQDTRNTSANKTKTDFGEFFSSAFKSIINQIEGFDLIDIKSSDTLEYPMTEDAISEDWDTIDNERSDEMIRQFMDKYKDHPFQYENAVYNIIKAAMLRIAHKATPFRSVNYENYRRRLNNFMVPRGVKGEVINALHDFIPAISLVRRNGDFNPDARTNPLGVQNKEYYLKTFINWLREIINPESEYFDETVYEAMATNPFLDILDISYIGGQKNREVGAEIFYLKTSKDADKYEKWGYSLGWDDLMNSDNANLRRLGHDLYMYFYYVNGLNPRYNWAMELAPVSVLETLVADKIGDTEITYPQIFEEKLNEEQITDDIIRKDLIKFLIYNSNDDNIVPSMPFKLSDVKAGDDNDTIIIRKELIPNVRLGQYRSDNFIVDRKKMFVRPIIKVDGALYILGTSNDFDRPINNVVDKSTQTLVYKRIQPNFDKETDFSEYYWERNNYIFGAFKNDIITDDKIVESDDYTVSDDDDVPDAVIAANEADDDSKVKALNENGEEVENCGD